MYFLKRRGHEHVLSLHLSSYIIPTRLQMLEHWVHLILSQSYSCYPFEHVLYGDDVCQRKMCQSTIDKRAKHKVGGLVGFRGVMPDKRGAEINGV